MSPLPSWWFREFLKSNSRIDRYVELYHRIKHARTQLREVSPRWTKTAFSIAFTSDAKLLNDIGSLTRMLPLSILRIGRDRLLIGGSTHAAGSSSRPRR